MDIAVVDIIPHKTIVYLKIFRSASELLGCLNIVIAEQDFCYNNQAQAVAFILEHFSLLFLLLKRNVLFYVSIG